MAENLSPHFRNHNFCFSADSDARFIRIVGFSAQCDRAQNIHDKVRPQHLNYIQRSPAKRKSSKDSKHTYRNIYCKLELEELTAIIEDGSSPFYRFVDGYKVVVQNDQVRVILGDITASAHTEPNICSF